MTHVHDSKPYPCRKVKRLNAFYCYVISVRLLHHGFGITSAGKPLHCSGPSGPKATGKSGAGQ